jgi:hypothetical protein
MCQPPSHRRSLIRRELRDRISRDAGAASASSSRARRPCPRRVCPAGTSPSSSPSSSGSARVGLRGWIDCSARAEEPTRVTLGSLSSPPPCPRLPGAPAALGDSTVEGGQGLDEARDVGVSNTAAVRYDVDDAVATPAASAAAALARVGEDEHMDSSCPAMHPVLAAAVAACPRRREHR